MYTLGQFVKERRKALGLTQKEVAFELGFSSCQFISNIERNLANIPIKSISKFAKALKVKERALEDFVLNKIKEKFMFNHKIDNNDPEIVTLIKSKWDVLTDKDKDLLTYTVKRLIGA